MRTAPAVILAAALAVAAGCAPDGEALFETEGCLTCHRFKGRGGYMGPDLTAVTGRLSSAQITRQIRGSSPPDPGARMPSYRHLSGREVRALVDYLGK